MVTESSSATDPAAGTRRTVRFVAATLSGLVAVLYLAFMLVVRAAEEPIANESTWGGYLFLAVAYVVGAVLLAAVDRRALWVVGAVVQVVVLTLFVLFGLGAFGSEGGAVDSAALADVPVGLWAVAITSVQLVLLGLLAYLSLTSAGPTSQQDALLRHGSSAAG